MFSLKVDASLMFRVMLKDITFCLFWKLTWSKADHAIKKNLVEYNKVVFDLYWMQLWVTRSNLSRYLMTQKEGGCAIVEWLRCHVDVKWRNTLSLVLYSEKYFQKLWFSSMKWVSENTLVISCYFNQKKVFISNSMSLLDVP